MEVPGPGRIAGGQVMADAQSLPMHQTSPASSYDEVQSSKSIGQDGGHRLDCRRAGGRIRAHVSGAGCRAAKTATDPDRLGRRVEAVMGGGILDHAHP